jgi:hypothetical protein
MRLVRCGNMDNVHDLSADVETPMTELANGSISRCYRAPALDGIHEHVYERVVARDGTVTWYKLED